MKMMGRACNYREAHRPPLHDINGRHLRKRVNSSHYGPALVCSPPRRGPRTAARIVEELCCVRPLPPFYSDASADGVEERALVPHSRSHARLRRNATMSHAFSCVQLTFSDL
ncbi:hypothetical protein EVAR_28849_1 [Eumeta japonica]|uniref:Uncharacterized protein n=1 Tax=Eumeta variegata TaxID=151549 RepID=A0A4C1YMN3_EUMVA|nr:hypothetical protein EVAR_28849_1 [Eumeta japonica]